MVKLTSDSFQKAFQFAKVAHGDQSYGTEPYTYHLIEVALEVSRRFPDDEDLLVAAALHDVLEDTPVTPEELWGRYGDNVTNLVMAVTAKDGSRKQRHETLIAQLERCPAAIPLKLADRMCNVLNCWKNRNTLLFAYQREYRSMRDRLISISPKGCEQQWRDLDALLGWYSPTRG